MSADNLFNSTRLRILLSILVCCLLSSLPVLAAYDDSYTVSVYQPRMTKTEFSNVTREGALALMNRHILNYEVRAKEAARRKSQILVFPEYGLYADIKDFTRDSIENFLEIIPDPKVNITWTPCDLENTTDDITIQRKISCMAKKNKLYIVANVGEREPCVFNYNSSCPMDGRYQYNTNVVYDPKGTLVSRYRKKHLFHEPYFNTPRVTDHQVFNTPFGKFASLICFDIYFQYEIEELKDEGVLNILFPNMWFNIPPLFLSVPLHASIAWASNINLISANLIMDEPQGVTAYRTGGSGFYSGMSGEFSYSHVPGLLTANMTNIKYHTHSRFEKVPKRKTPVRGNQTVHNPIFADILFYTIELTDYSGNVSVCYDSTFCCGLEYEFELPINDSVSYWLGVANTFNIDACTVFLGNQTLGMIPVDKDFQRAKFKSIRLFASDFDTPFVFPQVIVTNRETYEVLDPISYYKNGEIALSHTSPLHSMSLLNRDYHRIPVSTSHRTISSVLLVIAMLVLSLLHI